MARRVLSLCSLSIAFLSAWVSSATTAQAQRGTIPINIESVPPGATVYVDSTSSPPLGTTPLSSVRVPSGSHTFIFRLASHEEARLAVTVRRRREVFRAVLRALGTVEVSAANEGARGASVSVDGAPAGQLGSTPVRVTDLQPGRHQVRIERDGYRTFEQWVDVGGGQVVRVSGVLERAAPDTGSILVAGPTGATITLDGRPAGTTPTVIDGVPTGSHTVEIRAQGLPPYSQQVLVLAGQRATVTMPTAAGSTLRVIASAPGATISIDGEVIGPSPAVREGLTAGDHIVEASAEGYQPARQTVEIQAGRDRVISLEMTRVQGAPGRIVVSSNVPASLVIIDNEERGQAPVVYTPEAGTHAIVVRAQGYGDFSTTCETGPGQNCEINALLSAEQVRVRVAVQPGLRDAQLFVDDQPTGPVPFDGTLPSGSHILAVRAPGYEEYRQQVLLSPSSETRPFDIVLEAIQDTSEAERLAAMERERYAAVTHAAAPLPINQASIDLSAGWPYLAEVRLNVGLFEWLDAGFSFRTFGRLNEFEGRVRVGYRPLPLISVAGQVRFGGGIGPDFGYARPTEYQERLPDGTVMTQPWSSLPESQRITQRPTATETGSTQQRNYPVNSAFFSLELLGSLHFADAGAFTLWLALDLSSDEYAGHPLNSSAFLDYGPNAMGPTDTYCADRMGTTTLACPREDWARARLGGALELVLARNWNIWFQLEGILNGAPRRIMGNLIGIEAPDTQFYFRLGTTFKF